MKQNQMLIADGRIMYAVVKEAIEKAGFLLQTINSKAVLVWYDNLRENDFYSTLKPWQVVNRIPNINLICRKAPFIQLMNRMKLFFPTLYVFYPNSILLPNCNELLQKLLFSQNKKYIVKPDCGSLGCGIAILTKNSVFTPFKRLSVAQEYIESYLINDTKFDMRVYALVASVNPLKIYVYHDGIARFCSEKVTSNNVYSQLTNTAINRNNPRAKIESITKTIKSVFSTMEKKGIDTDLIWSKIENAVILSILPVVTFVKSGVSQYSLDSCYNRCFQILGFDFILDNNLDPFVLEVNYRPSLDTDTNEERVLKAKMLGAAMRIGAPLQSLQKVINNNIEILNFSKEKWNVFYRKASEKCNLIDKNVDTGLFKLVYPSDNKENMKTYDEVLNIVCRCPTKISPRFKIPVPLKKPNSSMIPNVNPIVFESKNVEMDDSAKREKMQQQLLLNEEINENIVDISSLQNDQQKNLVKLKQKNLGKKNSYNELKEKTLSSIVSNSIQENNDFYIQRIINEINLIKDLNINEPKAIIPKKVEKPSSIKKNQNQSTISNSIASKLKSEKKSIEQEKIDKTERNEKNEKAEKNEKIEEIQKLKTAQNQPEPIKQKQTKLPVETKNEVNQSKEIKLIKSLETKERYHRSASSKPFKRPIGAMSETKNNNNMNANIESIDALSKKYAEILSNRLKNEMNYSKSGNIKAVRPNSPSKSCYKQTDPLANGQIDSEAETFIKIRQKLDNAESVKMNQNENSQKQKPEIEQNSKAKMKKLLKQKEKVAFKSENANSKTEKETHEAKINKEPIKDQEPDAKESQTQEISVKNDQVKHNAAQEPIDKQEQEQKIKQEQIQEQKIKQEQVQEQKIKQEQIQAKEMKAKGNLLQEQKTKLNITQEVKNKNDQVQWKSLQTQEERVKRIPSKSVRIKYDSKQGTRSKLLNQAIESKIKAGRQSVRVVNQSEKEIKAINSISKPKAENEKEAKTIGIPASEISNEDTKTTKIEKQNGLTKSDHSLGIEAAPIAKTESSKEVNNEIRIEDNGSEKCQKIESPLQPSQVQQPMKLKAEQEVQNKTAKANLKTKKETEQGTKDCNDKANLPQSKISKVAPNSNSEKIAKQEPKEVLKPKQDFNQEMADPELQNKAQKAAPKLSTESEKISKQENELRAKSLKAVSKPRNEPEFAFQKNDAEPQSKTQKNASKPKNEAEAELVQKALKTVSKTRSELEKEFAQSQKREAAFKEKEPKAIKLEIEEASNGKETKAQKTPEHEIKADVEANQAKEPKLLKQNAKSAEDKKRQAKTSTPNKIKGNPNTKPNKESLYPKNKVLLESENQVKMQNNKQKKANHLKQKI